MDSYDDGGFSQSRGDDDLFDDDFTPLEPSEQQAYSKPTTLDQSTQQIQNLSLDESPRPSPASQHRGTSRGHVGPRGNPRGRGRGGRDRGGTTTISVNSSLQQSKYAPSPTASTVTSTQSQDASKASEAQVPAPPKPSTSSPPSQSSTPPPPPDSSAPTASSASTNTPSSRPPAVRGDRTLTGGPQRTKLTEAELTQKMAEARARSQALSTAHARAEADAASFAERERVAREKRERDRINRRVLEGERERNRERKMKALGGREWDAEKDVAETATGTRGRGGFMRGAHGGVKSDGRNLQNGENGLGDDLAGEAERGRGRGRGSRGRGRGRANGRGRADDRPRANGPMPTSSPQPDVSAETDFPSLPPGEKPKVEIKKPTPNTAGPVQATRVSEKAAETPLSPSAEGSWADQVDRLEAAKSS